MPGVLGARPSLASGVSYWSRQVRGRRSEALQSGGVKVKACWWLALELWWVSTWLSCAAGLRCWRVTRSLNKNRPGFVVAHVQV